MIGNCGHIVRTAATLRINLELACWLATSLQKREVSENERGATAVCSRRVVVSGRCVKTADLCDVQTRHTSDSVVLKCTSVFSDLSDIITARWNSGSLPCAVSYLIG
jgi:hypothetical protein